MPLQFVSEPISAIGGAFDPETMAAGEPSLPPEFDWRDERLVIATTRRAWRTTKVDRGDTYIKRHYFECDLIDGRIAVVYFERQARRGHPRWHLYTLED